jgi:hypothetical protein
MIYIILPISFGNRKVENKKNQHHSPVSFENRKVESKKERIILL